MIECVIKVGVFDDLWLCVEVLVSSVIVGMLDMGLLFCDVVFECLVFVFICVCFNNVWFIFDFWLDVVWCEVKGVYMVCYKVVGICELVYDCFVCVCDWCELVVFVVFVCNCKVLFVFVYECDGVELFEYCFVVEYCL